VAPETRAGFRQKVDNFMTNYLRSNITDQEILDFYGEGNIIGRKGIDPNTIVDETFEAYKLPGERPRIKREVEQSDSLMGLSGGKDVIVDIESARDPRTKNPWQMKFETLPFPGGGTPTSAAQRFLKDFRVPVGNTIDYGFETAPNVADVNARDIAEIESDPRNYQNQRAAFLAEDEGRPLAESGPLRSSQQEEIERLRSRSSAVTRPGGAMATPKYWESRGFELPKNLKQETLDTFKNQIMQAERPFGSVSQLTPVTENYQNVRPGGDPDWRANLYERAGFAGPMTEVSVRGPYGSSSGNVQMFTRGNERLLPIQPYTEFNALDPSKPSALGTKPAPDFTPLQKAVGTRNYLIGRTALQGRGSLGAPVRAVQQLPTTVRASVKPATKALLLDAAINYGLGASPKEAVVTALSDPISSESLGGAPTAAIERIGPRGEFVDTRSNTVMTPEGRYTNTGIAYKNGKPIIVPRGSVAGEGNIVTQTQAALSQAAGAWKNRTRKAGDALQSFFGQLQRSPLFFFNR